MKIIRQCKRWKMCPLCTAGVVGILNHQDELNRRYFELRGKGHGPMPIKKPDIVASGNGTPHGARDSDEWILYPNLMEQFTEDRYEDGSSRLTSTLLVFCEQGLWKGCLNDRDNDRNTFVSATSFTALLAVIEDKLKTSSIEWKAKGGKPRRGR